MLTFQEYVYSLMQQKVTFIDMAKQMYYREIDIKKYRAEIEDLKNKIKELEEKEK